MLQKLKLNLAFNRVEGDLEMRIEVDNGLAMNAWCSGTMYRGFEKILVGRHALDGIVFTSRICGICTTAHQTASVRALDMIAKADVPANAQRVRNIVLAAEHLQSDMRHTFLMFMADFANPEYKNNKLFNEVMARHEPFKGRTYLETIVETKKMPELIAILGGQWPHSSFMVPGGITSVPSQNDVMQCILLLKQYRHWYEKRVLGCTIERWSEVKSLKALDAWLDEKEAHRESELGLFIRLARSADLEKMGHGHDNFISFGSLELPKGSKTDAKFLIPAGFAQGAKISEFNHENVSEHVAYSWFKDYKDGKHPFEGETNPYATGNESQKYSWAKAPRYNDLPAETGTLAEMVVSGNPLFAELVKKSGSNVFSRVLSRLVRSTVIIPAMEKWLAEIDGGSFYAPPGEIVQGKGFGLTQASRGALGHWVTIENRTIERYQIITATAWNASPRDSKGVRGPIEEAVIGTDVMSTTKLEHIIRSFDPCIVCSVHLLKNNRSLLKKNIGL